MVSPRILRGIPAASVNQVAVLLLEAFALKVEHELRPRTPDQALRLVARSIAPDLGWVVLDEDGAVMGVVGVVVRGQRFSHLGYRTLSEEFGLFGASSRWLREVCEGAVTRPGKRQWHIEALAVDESARGVGIGTALLTAVIDAAREADMRAVGLTVVDVNERAFSLYEQLGFRRVFTLPTGWLTVRGGYRGVRFMRLDL